MNALFTAEYVVLRRDESQLVEPIQAVDMTGMASR